MNIGWDGYDRMSTRATLYIPVLSTECGWTADDWSTEARFLRVCLACVHVLSVTNFSLALILFTIDDSRSGYAGISSNTAC